MDEEQRAAAEFARLWGAQEGTKRGPVPRLSPRVIAGAAIAIADDQGLEALSMRLVAQRLSVSAMSLYTYVPAKPDLVAVMVDEAYASRPILLLPGDLRGNAEAIAHRAWALYEAHAWLLDAEQHRPPLGPNVLARYEEELAGLDAFGLTDLEMDALLGATLALVRGAARAWQDARTSAVRSGVSDAIWWAARQPLLATVTGPDSFPLANRVGSAAGAADQAPGDPIRYFQFGLRLLLNGLVSHLEEGRPS